MEDEGQAEDGLITLNALKAQVNCHLLRANLNWDNCLLLTSYGDHQTFVLMADGSHVVIDQSLRESINSFARVNNCLQSNICPSSRLLGKNVRGIIAGLNRLLPSGGLHNPNLVFYMARFLTGYVYLPDQGMVDLHLVNRNLKCRVAIPAYKDTFTRILEAADELSNLQLGVLHYLMHCYGYQHECTQLANNYHRGRQMRVHVASWEKAKLLWIVNEAYKQYYGQAVEPQMRAELTRVMERCYQIK